MFEHPIKTSLKKEKEKLSYFNKKLEKEKEKHKEALKTTGALVFILDSPATWFFVFVYFGIVGFCLYISFIGGSILWSLFFLILILIGGVAVFAFIRIVDKDIDTAKRSEVYILKNLIQPLESDIRKTVKDIKTLEKEKDILDKKTQDEKNKIKDLKILLSKLDNAYLEILDQDDYVRRLHEGNQDLENLLETVKSIHSDMMEDNRIDILYIEKVKIQIDQTTQDIHDFIRG